jgi:hypothetical protein
MIQPVNRSPSKFSMRHVPFSDDPSNADEFYAALGKVVCRWGALENQISLALVSLQKFPESEHVGKNLPRPWSAKVALWKKLFCDVPYFAEKRAAALAFIADTEESKNDRHLLQHSHWYGFENDNPLTANFRSIDKVGKKIGLFQCPVTLPQLQQLIMCIECHLTDLRPILVWIADLQSAHSGITEGPPDEKVQG